MIPPSDFIIKAPIYNPEKLICVGMNYVDHCTEQNIPVPEEPVIFSKFPSSITEPNGPVILPSISNVSLFNLLYCDLMRKFVHIHMTSRLLYNYVDLNVICSVFDKLIWCTIGSKSFLFGTAQFSLWARWHS